MSIIIEQSFGNTHSTMGKKLTHLGGCPAGKRVKLWLR